MSTVYIETTVPSYLVARPSRDIVVLAHQETTRLWWEEHRSSYEMFISQIVIEEITRGDAEMAEKRIEAVRGIPLLPLTQEVEDLAADYFREFGFPARAMRDAFHLAFAVAHGVMFMATWNFTHLANAENIFRLSRYNAGRGLWTPVICTPEELIEYAAEE